MAGLLRRRETPWQREDEDDGREMLDGVGGLAQDRRWGGSKLVTPPRGKGRCRGRLVRRGSMSGWGGLSMVRVMVTRGGVKMTRGGEVRMGWYPLVRRDTRGWGKSISRVQGWRSHLSIEKVPG
eukprot:756579-Hanusia_phi.AAC.6